MTGISRNLRPDEADLGRATWQERHLKKPLSYMFHLCSILYMAQHPPPDSPPEADSDAHDTRTDPRYGPVPLRYRHDGWVPDRQLEFIQALAECGCVERAAKQVGMSRASAYALRQRADAEAFRLAWDAALESAIERLEEAALSRAINGVVVPIFHHGEQVGERRTYNERLTMFLLRTRHVARYGRWLDRMAADEPPEARSMILGFRIARMVGAAWRAMTAAFDGRAAPTPEPEPQTYESDQLPYTAAPPARPAPPSSTRFPKPGDPEWQRLHSKMAAKF